MTDELFTALAKYEDTFDRVKRRVYTPSPGLQALQTMLTAIREHRPNYHTNLGCSYCVRSLVLEASGLYYTEKDRREKAFKATHPENKVETKTEIVGGEVVSQEVIKEDAFKTVSVKKEKKGKTTKTTKTVTEK